MREKRYDKAFCIAWRIEDRVDHGDAYFTYDEAEALCYVLNDQHPFMYHYPMHIEETENASEVQ